jgi:hypothetical protein
MLKRGQKENMPDDSYKECECKIVKQSKKKLQNNNFAQAVKFKSVLIIYFSDVIPKTI